MTRFRFAASFAGLLTGLAAQAAPAPLTYPEAAVLALRENPDLKSVRFQEESTRLRAAQAFAPNNPVFSLNQNNLPGLALFSDGASTNYSLSFTLGFPGKAAMQGASLSRQADATREQAASKEIEILSALSKNYLALAANEKTRAFLAEESARTDDMLALVEKKYSLGQASQVDVLNSRVIAAGIRQDILANENERKDLLTQFRTILRLGPKAEESPTVPLDIVVPAAHPDLTRLTELMLRNRHGLRSARHQVESAEALVTQSFLAPFPDFQLSAGVNIYHVPSAEPVTGVSHDYNVGVGIAIPLFYPFNELSGLRAARMDRSTAEAQLDAARNQALADLQTTFARLDSTGKEKLNLQNLVLPAAKAAYDLALKSFALGKADFVRLNDARSQWVKAQSDSIQKQLAHAQLHIDLTQQVGCDFSEGARFNACQ